MTDILREVEELLEDDTSLETEVSILLSNCLLSDAEVRVLAYLRIGGDLHMSVPDIAVIFGWSTRKAYYVLAALEEKGLMRRAAHGRTQ